MSLGELDRSGDVPLGVQLGWKLRTLILDGTLAAGARLPAVRELAATMGVNANTVRAVYGRLESDGLVVAQHGRGTFVAEGAQDGGDATSAPTPACRPHQHHRPHPRPRRPRRHLRPRHPRASARGCAARSARSSASWHRSSSNAC
jgi:DNA-binding transcriptional regulator YhcF (GntR family)